MGAQAAIGSLEGRLTDESTTVEKGSADSIEVALEEPPCVKLLVEIGSADAIEADVEEPPRVKLIDLDTALAFSLCSEGRPPEHPDLWERLLCEHFRIVRALREFPRQFSDSGLAKREWRRLRGRAKSGDRHRQDCIRAERQWRLMRAKESCEAGLRALRECSFNEAFKSSCEAWDWAAPVMDPTERMRKGRAAKERALDLGFARAIAEAHDSEFPKAQEQVAAEQPQLDPVARDRLAHKRARRILVRQFKLEKEAGRKRIDRALARAAKMKFKN